MMKHLVLTQEAVNIKAWDCFESQLDLKIQIQELYLTENSNEQKHIPLTCISDLVVESHNGKN